MEPLAIVVLAAGKGTRMGLPIPKVLVETSEGAMIHHVLQTAASVKPEKIVVVTGYQRELVEEEIAKHSAAFGYENIPVEYAFQKEQKGTGDAVKAALDNLKDFSGTVIILYGDVPLVRPETLQSLIEKHRQEKATLTLISATTDTPSFYGRVLRDSETKKVLCVREAKDCADHEYLIMESNIGIYAVDSSFLHPAIESLDTNNAQQEYLLTDIVEKASTEGQTVSTYILPNIIETQGVNTLYHLMLVNREIHRRRVEAVMSQGVLVEDESSVTIGANVSLAPGVRIGPNVILKGETTIEGNVVIEGSACLIDTVVKEGAFLKFGVRAEEAVIGANTAIGPFAHLRPGTKLGSDVKIGNFVETKKATFHDGAKASHLSYLGDCEVGAEANIGAGTITCNYDGYKKSKTTIGAGAFIGSNTSLVAPVNIGNGASIGAGSTITKDVDEDALALTRADQKSIGGWAKKKRERELKKKSS